MGLFSTTRIGGPFRLEIDVGVGKQTLGTELSFRLGSLCVGACVCVLCRDCNVATALFLCFRM